MKTILGSSFLDDQPRNTKNHDHKNNRISHNNKNYYFDFEVVFNYDISFFVYLYTCGIHSCTEFLGMNNIFLIGLPH